MSKTIFFAKHILQLNAEAICLIFINLNIQRHIGEYQNELIKLDFFARISLKVNFSEIVILFIYYENPIN
jgi:hypothetical protein